MTSPLVVTKLIGGLGNQLFQYAAGRQLAELNDGILKVDLTAFETYTLHAYGLHHFDTAVDVATPRELKAFQRLKESRVLQKVAAHPATGITRFGSHFYVREKSLAFDDRILAIRGNVYLEGYWQSENYFRDIRTQLRSELMIKAAPDRENQRMASRIVEGPSASIHVRLGDYVSDPVTRSAHGLLPIEYYKSAIAHMLEIVPGVAFYLFSDDPDAAAKMFRLESASITVVDINNADRNFEDLRLMSLADHHIVANSSFSWWGAWLGKNQDGVVVAPRRWFADPSRTSDDILPTRWIRL